MEKLFILFSQSNLKSATSPNDLKWFNPQLGPLQVMKWKHGLVMQGWPTFQTSGPNFQHKILGWPKISSKKI